jgi:hypothetical protein
MLLSSLNLTRFLPACGGDEAGRRALRWILFNGARDFAPADDFLLLSSLSTTCLVLC